MPVVSYALPPLAGGGLQNPRQITLGPPAPQPVRPGELWLITSITSVWTLGFNAANDITYTESIVAPELGVIAQSPIITVPSDLALADVPAGEQWSFGTAGIERYAGSQPWIWIWNITSNVSSNAMIGTGSVLASYTIVDQSTRDPIVPGPSMLSGY